MVILGPSTSWDGRAPARGGFLQLLEAPGAERPAGGGETDALDAFGAAPAMRLQGRGMLPVDGQ